MTTQQQRPAAEPARTARARATGAYPAAAAAFLAGLVYLWGEAGFRLAFQYYPGFDAKWVLWNGRVGDIAAMWLTISGVAAVVGVGAWLAWRRRDRVGSLAGWMIVLIGSAIAAPMIGEIGQASGSVTNGVGSASAVAYIAWTLFGLVVMTAAAVFARMRARR